MSLYHCTTASDGSFIAVDRTRRNVYSVGQLGLVPHASPGVRQVIAPEWPSSGTIACACVQRIDFPMYIPDWSYPMWTPDGRGIAYSQKDDNAWNVWVRPLDGSPARRLTNFPDLFIYSFAFSPDGRELVVSRGERSTDVVLIENIDPQRCVKRTAPLPH